MPATINQLVALLAVVDGGTFEKASRRLNLTQSTVTKRIQELEASMGFSIFNRAKRQATLTEQGEEFVALARETVSSFENLTAFNPGRRRARTKIRLGCTELSSLTWLPRFIDLSLTKNPNVAFEIDIDMSRNLLSGLVDGEHDMIVVPEMQFPNDARVQTVADVAVSLIGKPGSVEARQKIQLSDLAKYDIILQGRASGYSKRIRDWFSDQGITLKSSVRVDNHLAMVGLAMAGQGLCVAASDNLRPLFESGQIVELKTKPSLPKIRYCLVYMPTTHEVLFRQIEEQILSSADFRTAFFNEG